MAWRSVGGGLLLALLVVAAGCLGPLEAPAEADPSAATQGDEALHEREDTARAGSPVTVTFSLALMPDSRIPLDVESVDVDGASPAVSVETAQPRIAPGEEAPIVEVRAEPGAEVAPLRLEIRFFDGLGQANFTFVTAAFSPELSIQQTVLLRDDGPSRISFASSEGPLDVRPATDHAVPQYGYVLWPDGDRQPLAGFDHAVHVPAEYPNVPPDREVSFFVEAPDGQTTLWRLGDEEPVRGDRFTLTTEPGRHHLRLSVGPGESTTGLSIHTDYVATVNGTIPAGTPDEVERVDGATADEHAVEVREDANRITLVLRPTEPEHRFEDLDLRLTNGAHRTVAESATANQTLEQINYYDPQPGNYTAHVEASEGAGHSYELSVTVDY